MYNHTVARSKLYSDNDVMDIHQILPQETIRLILENPGISDLTTNLILKT